MSILLCLLLRWMRPFLLRLFRLRQTILTLLILLRNSRFTLTDNVDSTPAYTIYVDGAVNGQSGTVTNNTATNLNLTALSEGTHSIVVQAADDTGNDAKFKLH